MATAPIPGKISKLSVSDDGGTTWTPVLGRVDITLNLQKGEIDASHMDSQDWSDFLHGRKSATIDFTLRYLLDKTTGEVDPGQELLIDNFFASQLSETLLDVQWRPIEQTGAPEFTAKGFVTSLTLPAGDEAPQDMTGTLRISGAVTQATQV